MTDRKNEQRLEVEQPASVPVIENKKADILAFLSPSHFVDLPSGGKFYPNGHPLKDKDTIEIRFMTAKEEDILTSRSLLKKGIAIDRMLESILVDKSISLEDMLIGDKNALIVGARITGYGESYETKVQCPSCGANVRHDFDLSDVKFNKPELEIEKQLLETGTFKILLPITKLEVEVRLLRGKDEKVLSKIAEERKAAKQEESSITDQLRLLIVSINGERDRSLVERFVSMCPAGDAKHIRSVFAHNVPNIDLTQKFVCRSCDSSVEMEVPFTVDFFWSGR
jgi:hypothetical protein